MGTTLLIIAAIIIVSGLFFMLRHRRASGQAGSIESPGSKEEGKKKYRDEPSKGTSSGGGQGSTK